MAESLINTKRRINTIRSTEKITKARKLVASVKYQRYKKRYTSNLDYEKAREEIRYTAFSWKDKKDPIPPLRQSYPHAEKRLFIIRTSTLGLCGSYNYAVFKRVDPMLDDKDELLLIGGKGVSHYKSFKGKTYLEYENLRNSFSFGQIKHLRHEIVSLYKTGRYKEIHFVYTAYKNSLTFLPRDEVILPLTLDREKLKEKKDIYPPLFEPDKNEVLLKTAAHYLDSFLYSRLLESELSELSSRRNAMENATDNAEEIENELRIRYNKRRQGAITQEITEIVAGANAGKKKED